MNQEEARQWLRDFITEVNAQDNRATATPYYYELRYSNEESSYNQVDYGNTVFFTEKAANAYIEANRHNLPEDVYTFLCWGGRNREMQTLLESIGAVVGVEYERR